MEAADRFHEIPLFVEVGPLLETFLCFGGIRFGAVRGLPHGEVQWLGIIRRLLAFQDAHFLLLSNGDFVFFFQFGDEVHQVLALFFDLVRRERTPVVHRLLQ